MAELNHEEQAKVDRYEELEREHRHGNRMVTKAQVDAAQVLAERAEINAEARERWQKQNADQKKAEADRVQAQHDASIKAAQEAYKRVAQVTFPGTATQFEEVWPELLTQWQIRQTAKADEDLIASKRAQMGSWL